LGLHGKVDYAFDKNNKISLYNVYVNLKNQQVRDAVSTSFNGVYDPAAGNAELVYNTRSRLTEQKIYNSTCTAITNFLTINLRYSGRQFILPHKTRFRRIPILN
jgi:hypothetical protein